jgi:prepilin-type N-terminal cleavage/methylation domain-containing protein
MSGRRVHKGFTLAELLISLAILGIIATFTISKIISAQATSKYNAFAKEVVGMVSASFELYKQNYTVSSGTRISDLTQYMNYVSVDTTSMADDRPRVCQEFCVNEEIRVLLVS